MDEGGKMKDERLGLRLVFDVFCFAVKRPGGLDVDGLPCLQTGLQAGKDIHRHIRETDILQQNGFSWFSSMKLRGVEKMA